MQKKMELTQIVGIRLLKEDVKNLQEEARKKRMTLSGLIKQRIFVD